MMSGPMSIRTQFTIYLSDYLEQAIADGAWGPDVR